MSKGGSKFGRRSNWFKIKFLLEEQQKDMNSKTHSEPINALAAAAALHAKTSHNTGLPLLGKMANETTLPLPFKFDQTPDLTNPFFSAAMQHPLHPTLLHKAIEGKNFSQSVYMCRIALQEWNEWIVATLECDLVAITSEFRCCDLFLMLFLVLLLCVVYLLQYRFIQILPEPTKTNATAKRRHFNEYGNERRKWRTNRINGKTTYRWVFYRKKFNCLRFNSRIIPRLIVL